MPRYTGDFQGKCAACLEYVELAVGVQTDREPVALYFAPGGPRRAELSNIALRLMTDDSIDIAFEFVCPLCGESSPGRATCRSVPGPA